MPSITTINLVSIAFCDNIILLCCNWENLLQKHRRLLRVVQSHLLPTVHHILLDFSLTVKAATLIFISGCGSAISFAKQEKSGFIYIW